MKPIAQIMAAMLALAVASGCALTQTTPEQRLAALCVSYAATLSSLAEVKGRLSDQDIATINAVRPPANAACNGKPESVHASMLDVSNALTAMSRIKGGMQ